MKVSNWKVYDMEESIKSSGYPMVTDVEDAEFDLGRGEKLANAKGGGHNQFLSGLLVSFDLTCSNKMWVEVERYRYLVFVSSQSTMHRIAKFDLKKSYNEYVDKRIIDIMEELKKEYEANPTSENYLRLLYNNPSGFELTARLTTNYRCLRNVYEQRKNHRLPEWRKFCEWIETLPYAEELILNDHKPDFASRR
jgi:hypothetical protein